MRYPAYPEYKEGGIEWLGQVPEHWEVKRSDGIISSDRNQVQPDFFKDDDVFHYSIPAVQEYGNGMIEEGESIASAKQVITEKCLLVSKLNPRKATICLAEPQAQRTLCSTEFVVLKARRCQLSFLTYFTQTELFRQGLDSKVQSVTRSHQRAAPDDIYKFWAAWPPLSEQTAIADFLDRETGRIDALVANKRRLIELLREKRTALVSRTVTRGLPADAAREFDLEPHTRFKDSGIDWLGEVPEGWVVKKVQYLARLKGGSTPLTSQDRFWGDFGTPWVSPKDMKGGRITDTQDHLTKGGVAECASGIVDPGHVLVVVRSGILRHTLPVAINDVAVALNQDIRAFLLNDQLIAEYLKWLIEGNQKALLEQWCKAGTTVESIEMEYLLSSSLPLPSCQEQTAIATYLDRETSKIDRLVEKVEVAIERLLEYRTALITAAVTGKIDVRQEQAKEVFV